jgi:hypothetical protein
MHAWLDEQRMLAVDDDELRRAGPEDLDVLAERFARDFEQRHLRALIRDLLSWMQQQAGGRHARVRRPVGPRWGL